MGPQQLSEPGDVLLERRRRVVGRIVTPKLLDQAITRDNSARLE
jgi:hypothetical protein